MDIQALERAARWFNQNQWFVDDLEAKGDRLVRFLVGRLNHCVARYNNMSEESEDIKGYYLQEANDAVADLYERFPTP